MSRPLGSSKAGRGTAGQGFAARAAATRLLSAVFDDRQPLDAALESDAAFARLPSRDKALARAIVGTALRRHGAIEAALGILIEKRPRGAGMLLRVLEIAAAQILFMGVADHAAVSVAVDQIAADHDGRHFKGLANAVLRRMARERETLLATLAAVNLDTPEWLWQRWSAAYGEATAWGIADAHWLEPSLDITVKRDPEVWAERLGGVVLPTGTVRTIVSGEITALPGFAEGAWWIQDAAAALPPKLFGDLRGKHVIDLCAAPGGKTAGLAVAGATVTAVDISAERMLRVAANLKRLSLVATTVAADALTWMPPEPVDAVLLDAPCTATGTIRRHPDIAWLKEPKDVVSLAEVQSRMIAHAAAMLKPGGILVYCTCSLEPEEGEAHLAPTLARLPLTLVPVTPDEIGGVVEAVTPMGTIRTLPTHLSNPSPRLSGLDGFFVMRLKKG